MNGRATAPAKSGTVGEQIAMPAEQLCSFNSCETLRVTTLADENLCCDHLIVRCYEFLEQIDPDRGMKSKEREKGVELKQVIEECSRKVLEVSLGTLQLSNLQRARLLDILLWASDTATAHISKEAEPNEFFRPQSGRMQTISSKQEKEREPQRANLRTSILF
jgi:hypothetical protein